MRRKLYIIFFITLLSSTFGSSFLFAQTAASLDRILEQESITFGSASYLLLSAKGEISDEADFAEAVRLMSEREKFFSGWSSGQRLSLGEYSLLIMRSFDRSGGLMFRLLPGPRYAVRELAFLEIVQGGSYPNSEVSGNRAVRILERYLHVTGEAGVGGET